MQIRTVFGSAHLALDSGRYEWSLALHTFLEYREISEDIGFALRGQVDPRRLAGLLFVAISISFCNVGRRSFPQRLTQQLLSLKETKSRMINSRKSVTWSPVPYAPLLVF